MTKLLTVQEAAKILDLNDKTVKRYIEKGSLKAAWFGNRWRIKQVDLDRFIEERSTVQAV